MDLFRTIIKLNAFVLLMVVYSSHCLAGESTYNAGSVVYNLFPVSLYDKPAFKGNLVSSNDSGTKFIIIKPENEWYLVKTQNDKVGYVSENWITDDITIVKNRQNEDAVKKAKEIQVKKDQYNKFRKIHSDWSDQYCQLIWNKKVRIGMTKEQVIASWGKPLDINRTVTSSYIHEQWVYGERVFLYFEDGILTSFQD